MQNSSNKPNSVPTGVICVLVSLLPTYIMQRHARNNYIGIFSILADIQSFSKIFHLALKVPIALSIANLAPDKSLLNLLSSPDISFEKVKGFNKCTPRGYALSPRSSGLSTMFNELTDLRLLPNACVVETAWIPRYHAVEY